MDPGLFAGQSLELPDIFTEGLPGEEMFSVDSFFGQYLDELARGKRSLEDPSAAGLGGQHKAAKLEPGQTAGMLLGGMPGAGLPPQAGVAGGMPGAGLLPPQAGVAGGMQPQMLHPQSAAAQAQLGVNGMMGGGAGLPLGLLPVGYAAPQQQPAMPAGPSYGVGAINGLTAGLPGGLAGGLPGGFPAGLAGSLSGALPAGLPALPVMPAPPDLSASASDLAGDSGDGRGGHGSRCKTFKQQEANKQAQQRYRERKKQKFQEMEAQIEVLTKQLQVLQALQSRNQQLEGANSELQQQLQKREGEMEQLRQALDAAAEHSYGSHDERSPSSGVHDGGQSRAQEEEGCAPAGCCEPQPGDMASGMDYRKSFAEAVERLRAYMVQQGLDAHSGVPVTPAQEAELGNIVGRSCQLCQAALRAEGVKVMDLVSGDHATLASVRDAQERQRWQNCLAAMRLSGQQQEQLLLNRRTHLQRMRAIYEERQSLNMQAMSEMLPHGGLAGGHDTSVEGRLACLSEAGFTPVAKSSAELGEVLDRIKDNLRREQRAIMDLNCITVMRVLRPLQAAHYLVTAYPSHCDALALSNTLAKALGREEASGDVSQGASAASAGTPTT